EAEVLPVLRKMGIVVTAYGVLSRGLLAGRMSSFGKGDFRAHLPRFQGENLAANKKLVEAIQSMAHEWGMTPSQLCIAWALAKGDDIVPLIGARTRSQLQDMLGAAEIALSQDQMTRIEAAVPVSAV